MKHWVYLLEFVKWFKFEFRFNQANPEGQRVRTLISVLWATPEGSAIDSFVSLCSGRGCVTTSWRYFGARFNCITWIFLVVVVSLQCYIATFRQSRRIYSAMILPDLESS
jgi:hypothetical protein